MKELERRLREGAILACSHTEYLTTDGSESVYRATLDSKSNASAKSLIEALAKLNDLLETAEPEPQEPCVRHESDGWRYVLAAEPQHGDVITPHQSFFECKHCGVLFRKP